MPNLPRVMIIVATADLSGPAKGVLQLLESFRQQSIPFYLYNFKVNGDPQENFYKEAKKKNIDVFFLEQRKKSYPAIILQARKEAMEKNIDIIQSHGFKPSVIGFFLKYLCRLKWVCFMHGTTTENLKVRIYHFIDNIFQLFADRVILVSEAQRDKIFNGLKKERVRVLHNAIDAKYPVRLSEKGKLVITELGMNENPECLVAVGRLSPEKGFDVLIDAFAELAPTRPAAHLIIVGDGQERDNLELQVSGHNLQDLVHFIGYSETPGDYITRADIVVLPSRSEGIPNVALEAMALEKPVVATRVGGTPEVIRHNRDGILVPSENPEALAAALTELLDNPRYAGELAANGLRRIQANFSPKKRVARVLDIYQEIIVKSENIVSL